MTDLPNMTIKQAAELLGIDPRTVRRRISEGQLRGYRVGPRLIRLDRAEVEALVRLIPARGAR